MNLEPFEFRPTFFTRFNLPSSFVLIFLSFIISNATVLLFCFHCMAMCFLLFYRFSLSPVLIQSRYPMNCIDCSFFFFFLTFVYFLRKSDQVVDLCQHSSSTSRHQHYHPIYFFNDARPLVLYILYRLVALARVSHN